MISMTAALDAGASGRSASGRSFTLAVCVVSAWLTAGCASPPPVAAPAPNRSYVVLLDNPDGSSSEIRVTGPQGTTVLDKPFESTRLRGPVGNRFVSSASDVSSDFGQATAASPQPPERFELYFVFGGSALTDASRKTLPRIIEALDKRPAPDMSITGHTDTAGDERSNERLGLQRATLVADLLNVGRRVPLDRVSVESHGEKNPLVRTADGVAEPRNRRVEVTVR